MRWQLKTVMAYTDFNERMGGEMIMTDTAKILGKYFRDSVCNG